MAASPYKLSCVMFGHTMDVRSVSVTNQGCIISGSRDKTAKVWAPNGINTGFYETETLVGHTNFVSSVCFVPPNNVHANGLVLTGSNDHSINVYEPVSSKLLFTLKGHSNTVCCLNAGAVTGTFLSASWDKTAKYWPTDGSTKPLATLVGHLAAIWSVIQLPTGTIVTGSADNTVKLWSKVGDCMITLTGHTDCVRGLTPTSENTFLSVSNDATVRHWNATTAACLNTFYGHTNYIYSVSAMPGAGADWFVTSGEDRSVRVWCGGDCQQVITLPAQSVWSVAVLNNGDIVAGSSDGLVRVFSAEPSRYAEPPLLQQFDEEVAAATASTQKDLGGININELPGKEVLTEPGKKEGQTKLVREGEAVTCYSWSDATQQWAKVGDVMGASGGSQAASGKQLHNGKEYDYVFSVDIEEGKPPLKLPYNSGTDPWSAAQTFIHDNNLSQLFLDQVANFIVDNSSKSEPVPASSPAGYGDPLTGGNRYIPGGGSVGAPGADPFTGANRYVPPGGLTATVDAVPSNDCPTKPYFPQQTYLRFDQANMKLILDKLREFNQKAEVAHRVQPDLLEGVCKLADLDSAADPVHVQALKQLLEWPEDIVFPVLDIARLCVRGAGVNGAMCGGETGVRLFTLLRQYMRPTCAQANQMLALRIVCNMMGHEPGETLALKHCDYLLSVVLDWSPPFTKNMQVALATLLLNLSVAIERTGNAVGRSRGVAVASTVLPRLSDPEALFRGLIALGTLIWDAESTADQERLKAAVRASKEMSAQLERVAGMHVVAQASNEGKAANCAAQVLALVQM